jgi:hypothetical protein
MVVISRSIEEHQLMVQIATSANMLSESQTQYYMEATNSYENTCLYSTVTEQGVEISTSGNSKVICDASALMGRIEELGYML